MPITAEIAYAETVGLSCEVTIGLESMTAAAQVESAPSEGGCQCFVGTSFGFVPITAEIAHAEIGSLSCEVTVGSEPMIATAQVENIISEIISQSVGAAGVSVHIAAENVHVETVSRIGEATVGLVPMIAEAQAVSIIFGTSGSRMLNASVVESENTVQACVEVVSLKNGATADIESLEEEAAGHGCSNTGTASNKRKARQNAIKSKHRRCGNTGGRRSKG